MHGLGARQASPCMYHCTTPSYGLTRVKAHSLWSWFLYAGAEIVL